MNGTQLYFIPLVDEVFRKKNGGSEDSQEVWSLEILEHSFEEFSKLHNFEKFLDCSKTFSLSPSNAYLVTHHNVATDETEFEKKQLERIKIFPQKRERVSGIDSPTLREIANQNAKRLRVDGRFSFILWSLQIRIFHDSRKYFHLMTHHE